MLSATSTQVIRLTAPDSVFTSPFSEILEDFMSAHGDVKFEFIRGYDLIDLAGGNADVAIRFTKTIDDQSLDLQEDCGNHGVLGRFPSDIAKNMGSLAMKVS